VNDDVVMCENGLNFFGFAIPAKRRSGGGANFPSKHRDFDDRQLGVHCIIFAGMYFRKIVFT